MPKEDLPASRYHHGDLRSALVAAARDIVEREGPEEVSLRAVARAAGVSQAAPYHHFADKQALLAAVAADGFREFREVMLERAGEAAAPYQRLKGLGLGYVAYGVAHPALFRLMQGPAFQENGIYPDLDAARQKSYLPLANAVADCLPGASREKIRAACAGAWSIVHGMAILASDGRLASLVDLSDLETATEAIIYQLDIEKAPEA